MKRLSSLILCAIFLVVSVLPSCRDASQTVDDTPSATAGAVDNGESAEADPYAERKLIPDGLPEKDYGGYEFTFYLRQNETYFEDMYAEEETGDLINDAVYKRNKVVEERFNVRFKYNFDTSNNTTYETTAIASILAGDDINDLLALHGAFAFNYAQKGYLLNWNENMPYVNLSKSWWDADAVKNFNVGGSIFAMTGDLSYLSLASTFCLLFNKTLFTNNNIEYPYDMVNKGTWTIDQLEKLTKDGTRDLNGDGVIKPDADQYGLTTNIWSVPIQMFYSGGDRIISISADGMPTLTAYNERTTDLMSRLMAMVTQNQMDVYIPFPPEYDIFLNGKALLAGATLGSLVRYRGMDDDIGVLPFPKYNESTPNYSSLVDAGQNVFAVPVVASDPERTSIIVEALCAEGYKIVAPVYYENALQTKYARDEQSIKMIELIRNTRIFDYGYYNNAIAGPLTYIGRELVSANNSDFTSYYEKNRGTVEKNLEKLIADLNK